MSTRRQRSFSESDHYDVFGNVFDFPDFVDEVIDESDMRRSLSSWKKDIEENVEPDLQFWNFESKIVNGDHLNHYGSSLPWCIETNRISRNSCSSDSWTDDSVDVSYSPLEEKHYEDAMKHGAFSDATVVGKRERKKSFNQTCKRLSFGSNKRLDISRSPPQQETTSPKTINKQQVKEAEISSLKTDVNDLPQYMQRNCSLSEAIKINKSPMHKSVERRRKSSSSKYPEKYLKKLSSNGIPFNLSMDITIDEVHDRQQRFYSSNNIVNVEEKFTVPIDDLMKFKTRARSSSIL